ncbi:MAG: TatD family hydrolase [Planctomycetes bacterium]|nr:TatD family hydrolase [Planctomycetota bacterium]
MKLIDTHCHLDEDAFASDRDETVARAADAGVAAMITIGTTVASSREAVALAARYERVYAAVGIQPNYAAEAGPGDFEEIERLAAGSKVVAIGETGLDRYWDYAPFDVQQEFFARHVELARRLELPFVVHCREAEADVVAQLRELAAGNELRGVMHSFSGDRGTARACLDLGLYISFAGMVTFRRNDDLRAVAAEVPQDRLLVETDAPYLAPAPHRGKRNEPAHVAHTLTCLAEVRGVAPERLAEQTTANACRLFGLPDV